MRSVSSNIEICFMKYIYNVWKVYSAKITQIEKISFLKIFYLSLNSRYKVKKKIYEMAKIFAVFQKFTKVFQNNKICKFQE